VRKGVQGENQGNRERNAQKSVLVLTFIKGKDMYELKKKKKKTTRR